MFTQIVLALLLMLVVNDAVAADATGPIFVTQPSNVTASDGESFSVSVQVTTSNFSNVTWKINLVSRTLNASATASSQTNNFITASVAFGPISLADAGSFQLVATNEFGPTLSAVRTLAVNPSAPSITTHPTSLALSIGGGASFSVVASVTSPLTFQWKKNGTAIDGATSSTYSIGSVVAGDAGSYTVAVANTVGSVTSNPATLTLTVAATVPTIATQPVSQTVAIAAPVTLSVIANGSGLAYQWYKDGIPINGANSASYTITSSTSANGGSYSLVVTNSSGSVTSNAAILTVVAPSRLYALSVRSYSGPGADTLIMGVFVAGSGIKNLVARGVGPNLAACRTSVIEGLCSHVSAPDLNLVENITLYAALIEKSDRLLAFFGVNGLPC